MGKKVPAGPSVLAVGAVAAEVAAAVVTGPNRPASAGLLGGCFAAAAAAAAAG